MTNTGCTAALEPGRWIDATLEDLARRTGWSPVGSQIVVIFDECGDAALIGTCIYGVVRATGFSADGRPGDLLFEVDRDLEYAGHYRSGEIHWLVTRPCLRWRRTARLMLRWSAVRVIDAPSFRDATYGRTIATDRVRLL